MNGAPELLERWRNGEADAGDALARMCMPLLERFFAAALSQGDPGLIDETLRECYGGATRIRTPGQFVGYLLRIATQRLYAHVRRRHGLDSRTDVASVLLDRTGMVQPHPAKPGPDNMPLAARIAHYLSGDESFSVEDTAFVLGISVPQVRMWLTQTHGERV